MKGALILDTSVLIALFERHVALDTLLETAASGLCVVPECVLSELKRKKDVAAKAALALAYTLPSCRTVMKGDDGVLEAAEKMKAHAVVTNDRELAARASHAGFAVLLLNRNRRFVYYKTGEIEAEGSV
ncbi:MAG: PIN domain-containing protein [Methanomassiliicoccales archaeon]